VEEQRLSAGGAPAPSGTRREIRVVADAAELTRAAAEEVTATLARQREPRPQASAPGGRTPASLPDGDGDLAGGAIAGGAVAGGARDDGAVAPFPSFVLSGGSTPRALYRLLADADAPFRGRIDWPAIHFFWGDERHVPPDHPDSNYRMAREAMLDRVPAPAAHVHRIAGEEPDAARAAQRYERELIDLFGLRAGGGGEKDAAAAANEVRQERPGSGPAPDPARDWPRSDPARDGLRSDPAGDFPRSNLARDFPRSNLARDFPRFDLVLLGLGDEGHTASLFPGSPLLAGFPARRWPRQLAAAVWVEKLKTWRITLTPPALNHAATVIFLVSGAAKAPALAAVLAGEPRPELYPAQVVAPIDGRLLWLVDRAAAAQLRSLP
jgi:6-phosphogluconolactonase/glucosamine-6-phosphate isomerase/deaminase